MEKTLTEFIIEEQRRAPRATDGFTALLNDIRLACKRISYLIGKGALSDALGPDGTRNVRGEPRMKLDARANDIFLRTNEWGGHLAGMASEELSEPYAIPASYPRGNYLLVFDPLEGATNVDVNVTVGSIFSVYRFPQEAGDLAEAHFLQPGARQVCAGYALYGPTTMLVISLGRGVHGFTLDREIGEFIYTHPDLRVAEDTHEFAINASNARFWEPAVKRYVDECLAGQGGPRGKDFSMRWVASLVAETHRILLRGGVFMYPRDSRAPASPGRMHLLFQANPIGFLIEQAGGRASSGDAPILTVAPQSLHQRIGLIFGSRREVEVLEDYHRRHNDREYEAPLFGTRGLFRGSP